MNSIANSKKHLEDVLGGLFFMTAFTIIWTVIAEVALHGKDHWIIGIAFAIVIAIFLICYIKFHSAIKKIKDVAAFKTPEDKTKSKWFNIIFIVEGVAIFLTVNVLNHTGHGDFFIHALLLL